MPTDLPKQYDPRSAEAKWFSFWEHHRYFDADPDPSRPAHTIMIPLPNVTGALHMGHALNGTLQDLLTRWRRMQGYVALWMPGTDHAGIATQAVVERRMLEQEGLTRHDVGREALVQRIWKWKDEYEQRILGQLKRLGASCDWRRVRFTLDAVCSKAVRRTFFKMFRDGLIYRGKRLVNWDAFLQTAVADDEVYTEDVPGKFWTFSYPVVNAAGEPTGETIAFSTTRPETMLGDTAVCVHPADERYRHLVGRQVRIPLNGRLIPIIADGLLADKELGTGCVKVTPAHDPNDYACGARNKLPMINILNPDGTLNENGGPWAGMERYAAREAVVAEMTRLGHFHGVEDRVIPLKYSDRSKTPIEPYLSDQWFVKMDQLAQAAIDAVHDGRVQFFPERYASSYVDWLGEKRDWCISRQLWWGHRIPIWSKSVDGRTDAEQLLTQLLGECRRTDAGPVLFADPRDRWVAGMPEDDVLLVCVDDGQRRIEEQLEANGFVQDPDVLDTWFSSALWPHATLGWPDLERDPPLTTDRETSSAGRASSAGGDGQPRAGAAAAGAGENRVLKYFYPGSVLVTSRDIITLWVARMVLTGLYNMGDVPFRHVHVHPKILDGFGQGMSKSKGNGVDPLDLIERYGCDGMRFTIASFAGETQDVRLPVSYACPHCDGLIPQTLEHQRAKPRDGRKPRIKCPKCKRESQYASANFDPDPGEPVARTVSERFEYGRNFCNKLWNACRFAMLNLEGYSPGEVADGDLAMEDRWILSRLATVAEEVTRLLDRYQFDAATRCLRECVWNEFCDWYLELIKPRLRSEGGPRATAQRVLVAVVDVLLRLLHPFTPFITEELWQRLNEAAPQRGGGGTLSSGPRGEGAADFFRPQTAAEACIVAAWPSGLEAFKQPALETRFRRLQDTIVAVRNLRGVYNISPAATVAVHVRCAPDVAADLRQVAGPMEGLAKAVLAEVGPDVARPPAAVSFALPEADGYVPLEGLIDRLAERARQQKEAEKLRGFIAGHEKKLANASFVERAPPEVVQEVRETLASLRKQLSSVEDVLAQLAD
uniref:Valine--tRNA ligase n=1 Tax=Schlesneria paludicola TaxID=360056 RepID=A0A7C4QP18_9PLAN